MKEIFLVRVKILHLNLIWIFFKLVNCGVIAKIMALSLKDFPNSFIALKINKTFMHDRIFVPHIQHATFAFVQFLFPTIVDITKLFNVC